MFYRDKKYDYFKLCERVATSKSRYSLSPPVDYPFLKTRLKKHQMEKEKQYQIDRRNRIKQAQYEDYNNYLRQKYSTPPENREKLNIK